MSATHTEGQADDASLLVRLRAGDERAFDELVRRLHPPMVRVARLFTRSQEEAEEIAQECWTSVLEHLGEFEGRSALKTWVLRIVANRARTRGKQAGRTVPFSALGPGESNDDRSLDGRFAPTGMWDSPPGSWSDDDDPERLAERRELVALVGEAIEQLPPSQRQVVTLRDVEGLESLEVCALLELTEGNQRVLLHRGRTAIRRYVELRLEQGQVTS